MLRFSNETEITARDGVLHITVTAFHQHEAEQLPSGNRVTEGVCHHHWRCKDGQLFTLNNKAEWEEVEVTDRNEETAIVLAAVALWKENEKAKTARAGE